MKPVHCIFVRVFDDTNVYVTPETGPPKTADIDADADAQEFGRDMDEGEDEQGQPGSGCRRHYWECCNGLLPAEATGSDLPPMLLKLCSFLPLRKSCRRQEFRAVTGI